MTADGDARTRETLASAKYKQHAAMLYKCFIEEVLAANLEQTVFDECVSRMQTLGYGDVASGAILEIRV
jgi:hypothetical protein